MFKQFSISKLKYNPDAIHAKITDRKDSFAAKDNLYVIYPERFHKIGIASIDTDVKVLGIFIIMDADYNYTLVKQIHYIHMEPYSIETISIDDKPYNVLEFKKGNVIVTNTNLVKDADFVFILLDDFMVKNGNVPFYLNYGDISSIFLKAAETGVSSLGKNPIGIWAIESVIGRDKQSGRYIRTVYPKDKIDYSKIKFVGLSNVSEAYDNTFSLISGNYFDRGVTKALTLEDPAKTDIEDVYRI